MNRTKRGRFVKKKVFRKNRTLRRRKGGNAPGNAPKVDQIVSSEITSIKHDIDDEFLTCYQNNKKLSNENDEEIYKNCNSISEERQKCLDRGLSRVMKNPYYGELIDYYEKECKPMVSPLTSNVNEPLKTSQKQKRWMWRFW